MNALPFMLAEPIVIELAGLPQGKGRPRFVRKTGVAYTPKQTRDYEGHLRLAAQEAMVGRAILENSLRVTVDAFFPVPASWTLGKRKHALAGILKPTTRPDADNLIKVLDALNEIVWRDDKQIVDARIRKSYSDRPALRIEVEAV